MVLLQSNEGVPGGILHGPGGRTIDASGSGLVNTGTEFIMHLAQAHQTEIQIAGANAGQWTLEPAPDPRRSPRPRCPTSRRPRAPRET